MAWETMDVEGVFDCPCGTHCLLALSVRDGDGWLAVALSPREAVSLDRSAASGLEAVSDRGPASPLQAAVEAGGRAEVRVRVGRGPRGGLLGLVQIDCGGTELGIRVDASEAVALAVCRGLNVEVPDELVRANPPPWGESWAGDEVTSSLRRGRRPTHPRCPAQSWVLVEERRMAIPPTSSGGDRPPCDTERRW